jgi:uncharacterized protein YdaU (DUF1376 family)
MSKQPFLPLFFGDFLASTAEWSGEERSLYLTLLGHQWSLGSLPIDADKVRRVVQWDRKIFASCWPTVATKFEERGGRLYNNRLELHRDRADAIAEKRADAGSKGAAKRWQPDSKCHSDANSKDMASDMAVAKNLSCHPIHTIPIQDTEGAPKPRRASKRCPEDFEPDLEFAVREVPDIDAAAEAAKFRDWEFAKPRSDWAACWRTWVRKARDDKRYARATQPTGGAQAPIWG